MTDVSEITALINTSLKENRDCSVHLRSILRGHRTDVMFRVLSHSIMAAARYMQKTRTVTPSSWCLKHGWSGVLNDLMVKCGWRNTGPWQWKCFGIEMPVCLDMQVGTSPATLAKLGHLLREAWRRKKWKMWLTTSRNDAKECARTHYDEGRCEAARKMADESRGHLVIMSGGVRSPMSLSVAKGDLFDTCPFCDEGVQGTLDHVLWKCNGLGGRPIVVDGLVVLDKMDKLQRRLGWPMARKKPSPLDVEIMRWHIKVKTAILEMRHGRRVECSGSAIDS